jgi:hypothetical protein
MYFARLAYAFHIVTMRWEIVTLYQKTWFVNVVSIWQTRPDDEGSNNFWCHASEHLQDTRRNMPQNGLQLYSATKDVKSRIRTDNICRGCDSNRNWNTPQAKLASYISLITDLRPYLCNVVASLSIRRGDCDTVSGKADTLWFDLCIT